MRKRLSIKGGIFLLAILDLIAIGVAYAVEIERGISGSVIIGQVETAEETILLYPESTEGGRRVSVLKRQEGAPVLLG